MNEILLRSGYDIAYFEVRFHLSMPENQACEPPMFLFAFIETKMKSSLSVDSVLGVAGNSIG